MLFSSAIGLLFLWASVASAVENPSFEDDVLAEGGFIIGAEAWDHGGTTAGTFYPPAALYTLGSPMGDNVAFLNQNSYMLQDLPDIIVAGRLYSIEFDAALRDDSPVASFGNWRVDLRSGSNETIGSTSVTLIRGEWTNNLVVSFVADENASYIGDNLRIVLSNPSGGAPQIHIDNVRFDVPALSPLGMGVLVSVFGLLGARRLRQDAVA